MTSFPKPTRAQKVRRPIRKIGRYGKLQAEFNATQFKRWTDAFGADLRSAISGAVGAVGPLVVGHILAVSTNPKLRFDPLNIAPITFAENERMEHDTEFRKEAQIRMRLWHIELRQREEEGSRAIS